MGEKETMSGEALRESPTRASTGRESSAPSVSEGVTAPRDVASGQSSGRMENIGSSGQDGVGVQDDSAAPNLGSSGQERSGMPGDPVPDIDAAAAKGAAASSVGQLGGQKPGGGAASAAYAREAADGPELATGDSDGDAPESDAAKVVTKTNSDDRNN